MSDEGPRWYKSEREREAELAKLRAELAAEREAHCACELTNHRLHEELAAERKKSVSLAKFSDAAALRAELAAANRTLNDLHDRQMKLVTDAACAKDAFDAADRAYCNVSAERDKLRAELAAVKTDAQMLLKCEQEALAERDALRAELSRAADSFASMMKESYPMAPPPSDWERIVFVARAAERSARAVLAGEREIVARIWKQLGSPTYDELKGRSIHDLIDETGAERDTLRAELAAEREALQRIGEDFGVMAGEKRVVGIRRVLTGLRAELAAERERVKVLEDELDLREQDDCNEENCLQSQVDALRAELDARDASLDYLSEVERKLRAELAAERERYAFLAETNEKLRREMERNIQFWRSSERDRLRELLRECRTGWYLNDELNARIDAALGGVDETR